MPKDDNAAANAEAWERYRLENGIGATLTAYGAQLSAQIEAKLEGKYRQEQGRKDFWTGFYAQNPDLKADRKIVSEILDANIDALADLPVDSGEAYDRLADLARTKLAADDKRRAVQKEYSMYSGGPGVADGVIATPPSGQSSATLGDIIRSRKEKRRTGSQREVDDDFSTGNRFPAG